MPWISKGASFISRTLGLNTMGEMRMGMYQPSAKALGGLLTNNRVTMQKAFQSTTSTSPTNSINIPRLPVPALEKTLAKYLRTAEPFLNEEEYQRTKQLVEQFGAPGGIGRKLQSMLEERAKKHDNWLSDWWLSQAYLGFREPVVVNSSPGLVFPVQDFFSLDDQLVCAAKIIAGLVDFKHLLEKEQIPLEKMGKDPLDMSQYYRLLGTCRIPGIPEDTLRLQDPKKLPTYIVVAHNNQFFQVDVCDHNGNTLTVDQLTEVLYEVVVNSTHPAPPIGAFTTQHRDVWAGAYQSLMKDPLNAASITTIQNSLFLLSLDRLAPGNPNLSRETQAALKMIHGMGAGPQGNAGTRWYDKTLQLIVGAEGFTGLTYEHSPSEGPPVAYLMDHVVDFLTRKSTLIKIEETMSTPSPKPLKFNVSREMSKALDIAIRDLDILVNDFDMRVLNFSAFGKEDIKAMRFSPDSFIQVAIQLAFYRTHGLPGAQYESASTRKFLYGRTETIRSCLPQVVDFCKKMTEQSATISDLKRAIDAHKQYVQEAVNGQGIDRHLLGLKLLCIENGIDIPALYMDQGFTRSSHFRLSTSQVAARSNGVMGFGPVVSDGYGICYNPRNYGINAALSASNSTPQTSAATFSNALQSALFDMRELACKELQAKL